MNDMAINIQRSDIADALAEFDKLSNDELKELCNSSSDDKYDELVNQSAKVSSIMIIQWIRLRSCRLVDRR